MQTLRQRESWEMMSVQKREIEGSEYFSDSWVRSEAGDYVTEEPLWSTRPGS